MNLVRGPSSRGPGCKTQRSRRGWAGREEEGLRRQREATCPLPVLAVLSSRRRRQADPQVAACLTLAPLIHPGRFFSHISFWSQCWACGERKSQGRLLCLRPQHLREVLSAPGGGWEGVARTRGDSLGLRVGQNENAGDTEKERTIQHYVSSFKDSD